MKKLLLVAAFTGLTALSAGQYITTDIEGSNMHLELTNHTDRNIVYYVDSDNNPNTGITCSRIKGADLAIANGEYYDFIGEDGECDWDWDYADGDWDRGAHDLQVPLSTIAKADAIKITAHAYNGDWDRTYDFTKYGDDENEMKQVAIDTTYDVVADGLILFRVVSGKGDANTISQKLIDAAPALGKGWGLAHDEDMVATLQAKSDAGKLNDDGEDYLAKIKARGAVRILGFCNPNKAVKATYVATPVTSMMPCRISVFDLDDGSVGISLINATDPKFKGVMDDLKRIIENAIENAVE
jgi:hypothetical protein